MKNIGKYLKQLLIDLYLQVVFIMVWMLFLPHIKLFTVDNWVLFVFEVSLIKT